MMQQPPGTYTKFFKTGLTPDPILTVSEWADRHRILAQVSSAEPGFWRTSRTPYLREIMDNLSVISPVETVVFMKGAQVGGTEAINNFIGYIIDQAPGPTLMVLPRVEDAIKNSKIRIQPLIDACPRLKEKVKDARAKDSGNTLRQKDFPGGTLVLTGANSPAGLRSMPCRFLGLDEVDGMPGDVGGEGDPIVLAKARTRTFSKRKIVLVSTPTIQGRSRIELAYENSDQRRYFVPCPKCDHMQWLRWAQIKWDTDDELNAWYECEECACKIQNWQKTTMLERGEWRITNPDHKDPKVRGYHLSSLYSPVGWFSWGEAAVDWVRSQVSKEMLRGFMNTVLGETWADKGEAPDWKRLYERRESYTPNEIPDKVVMLTAGVDIQKDRIEVEILGLCRDKISYSIDYRVFMGPTETLNSEPWRALAEVLHETWVRPNDLEMPLKLMAIDSGYHTQIVYSWVKQFSPTKVIAIKGFENQNTAVAQPRAVEVTMRGKKLKRGLKLFPVGVNIIKAQIYGWLKQSAPDEGQPEPHGYCHFPMYAEEYFKQLTAEELVVKIVKGYKKYEWVNTYGRNEGLDCRVYAMAAAIFCGVDRYRAQHWDKLEAEFQVTREKNNETNIEKNQKDFKNNEINHAKSRIRKRKSSIW